MGLILDIVDKVVPRVMERKYKNGDLKRIIREELEKEAGQTIEIKKEYNTTKNTLLKPSDR